MSFGDFHFGCEFFVAQRDRSFAGDPKVQTRVRFAKTDSRR
jgi:hypothetical protein